MTGTKRRYKLEKLTTLMEASFREVETDAEGNPILDLRKDSDGNPIMQIPRGENNEPMPNVQPDRVYTARSKVVEKALPLLLKRLYLEMPMQKTTRQDTINGTRMFAEIEASPKGELILSEDIVKWANEKLADEGKDGTPGIGLGIFGKNLQVIENALNSYDHSVEAKSKE